MTNFNPRASPWSQKGIQMEQFSGRSLKKDTWKIDTKVYVEKERTMRGKGSQIYVEIDVKIDDKSMRFRSLRFLDFCEEYNVFFT